MRAIISLARNLIVNYSIRHLYAICVRRHRRWRDILSKKSLTTRGTIPNLKHPAPINMANSKQSSKEKKKLDRTYQVPESSRTQPDISKGKTEILDVAIEGCLNNWSITTWSRVKLVKITWLLTKPTTISRQRNPNLLGMQTRYFRDCYQTSLSE